jgi:hypothetical protein
MVKEILTAAGVKHRKARFTEPPAETYAIYFDDIEVDAADPVTPLTEEGLPRVQHHDVTVEVYEPHPDDDTEQAIEAALNARGISWTKEDREWLQDVQRYQVLYTFNYITK